MVEGRHPLPELELRSDLPTVNCDGPVLLGSYSNRRQLPGTSINNPEFSRIRGLPDVDLSSTWDKMRPSRAH